MSSVILGSEPDRGAQKRVRAAGAEVLVPVLFAFGLVITFVSVVDLGLAWIPIRIGSGEWEFGTVSTTFNAMPLTAMGLVFLAMGALLAQSTFVLRIMSGVFLLVVLFLLGASVLYVLNVPVALGAVPPEASSLLKRAILRTSAFAGLYTVLFGWLCWFTWRQAGAAMKGK
jgi:hypothetical protein